jgi:hypothetical protein
MTAATVWAEFTVVIIVGAMTATAAVACLLHRRQRTAMTVITGDINMSTVDHEVRLRVVIKQPQVPGDRVMAGLAVVLKLAGMRIVLEMTADALCLGSGKHFGFVAGLAFEIVMLSQKRESCQVMIEPRRLLPCRFRVAVGASVTLLSFVDFVIEMAGRAGGAGRSIKYWFDMAVDTGNGLMRTVQYKLGIPVMVKTRGWPFIVGMAVPTICAVVAFVIIVFEMATDTLHVHVIGKRILSMTIIASQLGVTP